VVLNAIPATTPGVPSYTRPQLRIPVAKVAFHQLAVTDSHGTWLTGEDGIYLLEANRLSREVSDVTAEPSSLVAATDRLDRL
jgi:hypothetical protein